jgi:hypothetical protein
MTENRRHGVNFIYVDVSGAKAVYEELKPHFPGGKRSPSETETEAIT